MTNEELYNKNKLTEFVTRGSASVIVGGQFGSEAKGLAAGIVATYMRDIDDADLICTTNAGAQAGHTSVMETGEKFVCYHLPTIGVYKQGSRIYLNAGSIISPLLLIMEIGAVCQVTGESPSHLSDRIVIHPNAAVISDFHQAMEAEGTKHLGSTRKGVGAALADKIMRKHHAVARNCSALNMFCVGSMDLQLAMQFGKSAVTVEIPQGTGLSLNNSYFYPHCTSRDCWVGQGLADAGIHPWFLRSVMQVQRTMPIRVGHIYDADGEIVGNSGPFYSDSSEISWDQLPGIEPEITTVTKRRRRIATWSQSQYSDSLRLNRPTHVLNTFCNYLSTSGLQDYKRKMLNTDKSEHILPFHYWSFGPKVSDLRFDIGA